MNNIIIKQIYNNIRHSGTISDCPESDSGCAPIGLTRMTKKSLKFIINLTLFFHIVQ